MKPCGHEDTEHCHIGIIGKTCYWCGTVKSRHSDKPWRSISCVHDPIRGRDRSIGYPESTYKTLEQFYARGAS